MEQLSKRSSKFFNKISSQLGKYAYFEHDIIEGKIHLKGPLDVGYGERNQFEIEIIVDEAFPKRIPEVHETGGRIPSILDRHYMSDGSGCCLVIPHRFTEYFKPFMTFENFIDIFVIPFFRNQIYYEINGHFAAGYKHGEHGMWEYYVEIFGSDLKLQQLSTLIKTVLDERADRKVRIKGHKICPCGGGLIQRHCHGSGLIKLKEHGVTTWLKQSYYIIQQKSLYKRIVKGELVIRAPDHAVIVNTPNIIPLGEQIGGITIYDITPPKPGSYVLKAKDIKKS